MTFLSLEAVSKSYGNVEALVGIDLRVSTGSRTAVVGPSASGKTTLLRIIAGFERPDRGHVKMNGQVLADDAHVLPAYRRGIGFVAQDGALFPHLKVADNIGFGLDRKDPNRAAWIAQLLDLVSLDKSLLERWPHELSGGQQQRVALARALALRPKLMLLDEPFSALDTSLRAATRNAVAQTLAQTGITTILVTHDQAEALSFADQVAVLQEGRLAEVGASRDLYWRPKTPSIASYLGEAILLRAQLKQDFAKCALGSIPIAQGTRDGAGTIMLRPEQVRLTTLSFAEAGLVDKAAECTGLVTEVEFGGATSTVTVRLATPTGIVGKSGDANATVRLAGNGVDLPAVGASVRISVDGSAHVFASDDA